MTEKKLKVLDLDTPSEIVIKPSQVEPHKYGIWCKQLIKEGTKFGPFVGEKAYEVDETMDPAFIWEIVDVETKEFLFYINATNPRYGNWMRHINCARFFEEQNIVSEQEGIDIYYHAIKDIQPGDELLTWYEKSPVRKKKGKKKIFPNVKRARTGDESKVASKSFDSGSVSLRGRKRTARKFWEMEEVRARSTTIEGSEDDVVEHNVNNDDDDDDEDWDAPKFGTVVSNLKSKNSSLAPTAASSGANSVSSELNSPDTDVSQRLSLVAEMISQDNEKNKSEKSTIDEPNGLFFNFESMVDQGGSGGSHSSTGGSWKNGRRVFRCDICSGVYRHSFSLKRHYVRCHINFKYLTKVDIIQCGVQPRKPASNSQESTEDLEEEEENITQTLSDWTTTTKSSTISEPPMDSTVENPPELEKDLQNSLLNEIGCTHKGLNEIGCTHKGLMPDLYRCNICEQFFATKEELCNHLSNHPDGEASGQRQFSCSHCKMQFKHRQNLLRHEVVHTGAKPFSCQQCHKSFPTVTNQKRHEKIHDGHRLTCDLCPATFTQTGDLKKHASKQHPESYNECAYCSKYFSMEVVLDAHLKKAHGKDVEANRRRVCVKKKEKKVLLEKDRAESRRLAIEDAEKRQTRGNPEESYACTVCRKCFHNYSNMCRHRRLAHYKDSKVDDFYGLDEEDEIGRTASNSQNKHSTTQAVHQGGVSTRSSGVVSVEIGYKHFLAVARTIPKNLEFFIEGTQQDLDNAKNHIKWKDSRRIRPEESESDVKEDADQSVESSLTIAPDVSLEEYNFPKGFQINPKINISNSEIDDSVTSEDQRLFENGEHSEVKTESENNDEDDKTYLKCCDNCKMNFADEKGFAVHTLNCSSLLDDYSQRQKTAAVEDGHDYSRKANPKEEAFKVFPELSKLPTNLFSDEEILDLSRHKDCIYQNPVNANRVNFPCIISAEEPLDLTGSKEKEIIGNLSPTLPSTLNSSDCNPSMEFLSTSSLCSKDGSTSPETKLLSAVSTQQLQVFKPGKKVICLVCYMEFHDREAAVEHQETSHGNVDCRHAEVDNDFEVSMLKAPKSVGLLGSSELVFSNVSEKLKEEAVDNYEQENKMMDITELSCEESSNKQHQDKVENEIQETSLKKEESEVTTEELLMTVVSEATLPESSDITSDDEAVICTKCRQKFSNLSALHNHISDNCGDYWKNLSERVSWVFVLRGNLIQPEQEQPSGSAAQPKKRGKFKWHQISNPPLFRSNSTNDENHKKQLQSSTAGRSLVASTATDASRKIVGNKVLTRKRSQEIGATVVSGMEDPDYYVRSKRRAIMQQQNLTLNASKKGLKRQTSLDSTLVNKADGSDSNQANSSLDEEILANLSDDGFNEDDNDEDDDYDPNKFMCIYCRHQFQYTRTLRKHVLEFCHVRREFAEKGEYLDVEWEEELALKVIPPPVTPSASEPGDENEETKKSGGRRRKRRSWCTRGYNQKQPSQVQDSDASAKQHNYLPVQLQLSVDQAHRLKEVKCESDSNAARSVPMTTPGGTIVLNAEDVHNGESDLMVSCDSIPNEDETDVESSKSHPYVGDGNVSLNASTTFTTTAGTGMHGLHDSSSLHMVAPLTSFTVDKSQQSKPQLESSQHITEVSVLSQLSDISIERDGKLEEEEEDDATGLLMTVTSSPAAKHPQIHPPWEISGKRKSDTRPPVSGKRKKLLMGEVSVSDVSRSPDRFEG